MTTNTKTVQKQTFFLWMLLGPLSAMASCSLLYIKAPKDFQFVLLAALTGLLITWVGRLKGLILSIALLSILSISVFIQSDVNIYWTLGSLFSIALSFTLTYLTLDEAEYTVNKQFDVIKVDVEKSEILEAQLVRLEQDFTSSEKNLQYTRNELLSAFGEKETLNQQLFDLRLAKRKLEEEIEDQKISLEGKNKLIEKLRVDVVLNHELSEQLDTLIREKDLLEGTVNRLQEELEKQPEVETKIQVEEIEELPAQEMDYRRLSGMYRQLRDQFNEKNSVLEQTRAELFKSTEKNSYYEKQIHELEMEDSPQFRALVKEFESLSQQYNESQEEIAKLESLISSL